VRRRAHRGALAAGCAAIALLAAAPAAPAFSPDAELTNFAKVTERERYITLTPEFLVELHTRSTQALLERVRAKAEDPERSPTNVCGIKGLECAGDIRFHDWHEHGDGVRKTVLFTARSGATISGHVWATRRGPAQRPGIVITTGSVQAPEELYWGQAATLAKHGYVVLTYDVQGQGASDTFGEAPDEQESVPAQQGQPFYDGTEDALDFLLSGPGAPYSPRPSCTTATDHSAKQERRVAEGFNAAYNPLHDIVDSGRIGIAGHSLGAAAVSFVGQRDPRVDATVAWDNLGVPDGGQFGVPECASAPETRETPEITRPALGISNDYGIAPQPFTSDPDPQGKNGAFLAYRDAGVDSGEVVIRGGCHEESAFLPVGLTGPYPIPCGTLRGGDLVAWYTTAWFDKYVKGDPGADARLLSDRWRHDRPGTAVDLNGDGNLHSFYFRSVLDVGLAGGGRAVCDDLRAGCPTLGPDGGPIPYDFVADAWDTGSGGPEPPPGSTGVPAGSGDQGGAAKPKRSRKKCKRKKGKARKRCIKKIAHQVVR
jgi:dienelactone hydrolase